MEFHNPQPKPEKIKLSDYEKRKIKLELLREQFNRCYNCRCWLKNWAIADLHHIKNRSLGGDDSKDNLVVLCRQCHRLVTDGKIKISKSNNVTGN